MDYTEMTAKEIIKKTRHGAEKPLRIIAFIFSGLVYLLAGFFGLALRMSPELYETITLDASEEDLAIIEVFKALGLGCAIVAIVAMIVMFLFVMYKQYAKEMSYSVRVSETNFPEIYAKTLEFSEKLGLKKVPEVYITQCNGVLNAFATMVPGKRYVQLNAEIVDIAYMENKDFDAVYFTMAHEFGHIYFKHVTIWYALFTNLFRLIPLIGPSLTRAMEYSCDRAAQALTENNGAVDCMMMLGGGRHLYKYIDANDFLDKSLGKYNFLERLSRFLVNAATDHPIMPYRVKAIMDPERKSGRLF